MVRVGKGSLVGYGLVRIGGTGVGVGHARHAQLARVVARLIQIGHHDGRACSVLVHGHARLAIPRSILGDVEAKGTRAVERHGRGGFGAKANDATRPDAGALATAWLMPIATAPSVTAFAVVLPRPVALASSVAAARLKV